MLKNLKDFGIEKEVVVDYSLVRGLGYYTGLVVEVMSKDYGKSIAGGGRYDKLIGIYGKQDLPATGISFGFERIVDIMTKKKMF